MQPLLLRAPNAKWARGSLTIVPLVAGVLVLTVTFVASHMRLNAAVSQHGETRTPVRLHACEEKHAWAAHACASRYNRAAQSNGWGRHHAIPFPATFLPATFFYLSGMKFRGADEEDWQAVYNVASVAQSREEFLQLLRAQGYVYG